MNFLINPIFIDIVIIFTLFIAFILGYVRGFIYRGYDLFATIVAVIVGLYASSPLAMMFKVYQVEGIGEILGDTINRFIVFIIIFLILKLIFFLIGLLVKPLLKKVVYAFDFFEKIDRLLGVVVSCVESLILIYLALIFVVMPIVPGGKEAIGDTQLAKRILNLIPSVNEQISSFDTINDVVLDGINYDSLDANNLYLIAVSLNNAVDLKIIDENELNTLANNYYQNLQYLDQPIDLNKKQYDEVTKLLEKLDTSKININLILDKITVSE